MRFSGDRKQTSWLKVCGLQVLMKPDWGRVRDHGMDYAFEQKQEGSKGVNNHS